MTTKLIVKLSKNKTLDLNKVKWTNQFLEMFTSFFVVYLLIIPESWNLSTTQLTGMLEVIAEINILSVLWIILINFISWLLFFKKFKITSTPIILTIKYARKNIKTSDFVVRIIYQALGGIAAAFFAYSTILFAGRWELGVSTLSSSISQISGFLVSWNNSIDFSGEPWFSILQFFLSYIVLLIALLINITIEKTTTTKWENFQFRVIFNIFLLLISTKFFASYTNIWKSLFSSIVSSIMDGAFTIYSMLACVSGQFFAYTTVLLFYRKIQKFKN